MKVNVVIKSSYEDGVDTTEIVKIFTDWQYAIDYIELQTNPTSYYVEEHEVLDDLVL